ncbi:MAG: tetratricopeptide repeat protein [Bacillota bacterium]|nr:tetratricopeptide repeat protein [Bacillota bacterium]HHT89881.1 tetratricopeptide repeat protein [Bacillota bacterium]
MTPDIDALYEQALAALERWELDEAEEALRSLIQADPEHARAHNKLGVVLARREDFRQAEDCFNQALLLDSKLASAHSNLGNIYAERGWTDRAKDAYERAIALDPGNPTATHNLGVLYKKSGDIGKGIELMKQASRSERTRIRDSVRRSPKGQRMSRITWAVALAAALLVFYFLNR